MLLKDGCLPWCTRRGEGREGTRDGKVGVVRGSDQVAANAGVERITNGD